MAFDLAASARALAQRVESSTTETAASSPTTRTDSANPPDALLGGEAELKLHRRDAEDWGVRRPEQTAPEHALTGMGRRSIVAAQHAAGGGVDLERRQL